MASLVLLAAITRDWERVKILVNTFIHRRLCVVLACENRKKENLPVSVYKNRNLGVSGITFCQFVIASLWKLL